MSIAVTQETETRDILSVSALNQRVRRLLEVSFAQVWVEGEISNLAIPSSGHWYFTLKDNQAQIRCAMFRGRNRLLGFIPEDGAQVLVRGKVGLYEGRGDYQLVVDFMEASGDGALRQAFEQLKLKLAAAGLFAAESKRAIPAGLRHIAIITSPTGAAIRDVLTVFKRRFPALKVTIIPSAVQGKEAPAQLIHALKLANSGIDDWQAVLVTRGGGSLEDLWAFNNEQLAYAIHDSKLPVISAVGHEIDITIADLVADLRAPTPSAAAELLSLDQAELMANFQGYQQLFHDIISTQLHRHQERLQWLQKRLRHPGQRIQDQQQRLDDLELRLRQVIRHHFLQKQNQLHTQQAKILQHSPQQHIRLLQQRLTHQQQSLSKTVQHLLPHYQQQLVNLVQRLQTLSPLATLERGYAIIKKGQQVIRTTQEVIPGDQVTAKLSDGELICNVIQTLPKK
ncbi:exodeoxyribonuclease VII large subunit [Zooshikella ganghwensis]|uniref:Exodeoxyribonuclease 7 large subunit n=1 Tax=Zooshikella ganghwensis TaxID=202772 RepID=A0A4P9VKT7_9GAMM|nr:exodeoxyribonuclease VII large subunit [Zooshikella ganghwensis]RDH43004.1 exodeoxyribonuclease VII large subunit [Zooshikella ganghwensis]